MATVLDGRRGKFRGKCERGSEEDENILFARMLRVISAYVLMAMPLALLGSQ